jgi:hypothetical protein
LYRAPSGTTDILPEEQAYRRYVEQKAVYICQLWNLRGVTLSNVRERIPKVRQLCPPGEPDYSATTDIEKDIQTNIDVLNQGKATSAEQQTKSDSS